MPVPDMTLPDQSGRPWHLAEQLDPAAALLVFYRGDW
jgi:peroxiredoxin